MNQMMSNNSMNNNSSNTITLETLGKEYNAAIINYQQAYQDLTIIIQNNGSNGNNGNNLMEVPGKVYFSTNNLNGSNGQNISTGSECQALCQSTTGCSGATYNVEKQLCVLGSGNGIVSNANGNYVAYVSPLQNAISNVEYWNGMLIQLNQRILTILEEKNPHYLNEVQERNVNNNQLKNNLRQLIEEKNKVNEMIDYYQSKKSGLMNTSIVTTENYSKYIMYSFIAIIIFIIFIKVVFMSDANGQFGGGGKGGSNDKLSDILFLFGLMFLFLTTGFFFKENAGIILVFLAITLFVLIKMKIMPNFFRF